MKPFSGNLLPDLLIPENSTCMEVFAVFGFRRNFQISLLKTAFGGIPLLETNFGGIDCFCWMMLKARSDKVRKNVGGIGRDFGGIAYKILAELPRLRLVISTAHENPIPAELEIVGRFFCFRQVFF